jgi:hypothetical protein
MPTIQRASRGNPKIPAALRVTRGGNFGLTAIAAVLVIGHLVFQPAELGTRTVANAVEGTPAVVVR